MGERLAKDSDEQNDPFPLLLARKLKLIFFDIDGTLLISQGAGGRSIVRVMRSEFGIEEEIARVKIHGQTDRGIASELFAAHGIADTKSNWEKFTAAYLAILGDELEQAEGSLLPGVTALLEELTRRPAVEMALLTGNIFEGAQKKINHFGIGQFFEWGGFGDHHHDRSDMARHALQTARQRIELKPEDEVFVIGDTPNDVRCGKAISARTIAVATAGYTYDELLKCEPDHLYEDLSDLDEMIAILG